MKALSIRQPWAWLILHGGKSIENRNWKTDYRGPLVIHAGQIFDRDAFQELVVTQREMPSFSSDYPTGGFLGSVILFDCVHYSDIQLKSGDARWAVGPWCWILTDPKPWSFIYPALGNLRLWDVPHDVWFPEESRCRPGADHVRSQP